MEWNMRTEFEIAYKKANEVLNIVRPAKGRMVPTASLISAVEQLTGIDVRFAEFDFRQFSLHTKNEMDNYGAAMSVEQNDKGEKTAYILLNKEETPPMKRFSLVHELGHLITQDWDNAEISNAGSRKYRISTHINMNITSIPDEKLEGNDSLIEEQTANIFALLVLIPYNCLIDALNKKTLKEAADSFGVEVSALESRITLGGK